MPSPLVAVAQPVSTVDAAAAALRNAIATGRLKPGTRIKEIPVAAQLGLKRGAVRDALKVLAAEGIVHLEANQGATVKTVRADDLMELYALRLALGNLALRRLLHHPGDLAPANAELDRLGSAARRGHASKAVDADLALQDALVAAARLSRTASLFAATTLQLRVFVALVGVDFRPALVDMHDEDRTLLDLVSQASPAALEAWHRKLHGWVRELVTEVDQAFDATEWLKIYGPQAATSARPV